MKKDKNIKNKKFKLTQKFQIYKIKIKNIF